MIPYDTCDIEWNEGKQIVASLRATGKYSRVVFRKRQPENGKEFGRIYVERQPSTP